VKPNARKKLNYFVALFFCPIILYGVNEKNKRKRQCVTLDRKWHRRLKILSAKFGVKMEELIDEAAATYIAKKPMFESENGQ
jgi:hypothetical protein